MRVMEFDWIDFLIRLGLVVATIILGLIAIRVIVKIARKIMAKSGVDRAVMGFASSLIKSIIILIMVFLVGYFIGVPITALVAIVGAVTVALGLALQGSLANIASGIVIAITKPFVEGDFIDTGGVSGKVREIKLFNTELVTIDNKKIFIPNGVVANNHITNFTNQKDRMIEMIIPISYSENIDKVKEVLLDVAIANPKVHSEPLPIIRLHAYSDSSLDIIFRVWVNTAEYWEVYWDIRESIVAAFNKNEISIPFNKLDVHLVNDNIDECKI